MERPGINQSLLEKRYFQGEEKSWGDVALRVARHAGAHVGRTEEFYHAINNGEFFPSRMTYMGTEHPFASSCFVFPLEDDLASIMQTLSHACQVQKFGGGTGYNFSRLRPKGDLINSSKGEASGPVSFMGLFHKAMEVVHRAGKKHAAQMAILNVDHPEVEEFITCKDTEGAMWTFNISVAVTDNFMAAVEHDTDWDLRFGGKVYRTIRARDLWDKIIEHAWHNGDPGIIFIDTVNRNNCYPEDIEACNPCGEQMLPPYVSCNLGSIDLSKFVAGPEKMDWKRLEQAVRTGVRFLDASVEIAYWPVKQIEEKTRKYQNIGLGVMGWADALILMETPYDSEYAVHMASEVMSFIRRIGWNESVTLGGGTRKNTTVTSIAPTGSISMLANCSSGIEPNFGIVTQRHSYSGSFYQTHWIFEQMAREQGWYSEELMADIALNGSVQNVTGVPESARRLFKTAMEIDWEWHVKHQAAFQAHTDNAVSKTINLPNNASVRDVGRAYNEAYLYGCKSITVYRDGSREVQVLDNKTTQRETCPNCNAILFMDDGEKKCVSCGYKPAETPESLPTVAVAQPDKLRRPAVLHGSTYRKETPLGKAYITVNSNGAGPSDPLEVFVNVGKAGSEVTAVSEAMGRLISFALRLPSTMSHMDRLSMISEELNGIGGGRPMGFGPNRIRSLPDGIAQALREYTETVQGSYTQVVSQIQQASEVSIVGVSSYDICPECGEAGMVRSDGCEHCTSCGFSQC